MDANGEVQPDRREANRLANIQAIRQASANDASYES